MKSTLFFGVVQLYNGLSCYNWLSWYKCTMVVPWYKCTTPKKHGITTLVLPWWNVPRVLGWSLCNVVCHGTTVYLGTIVPPQKPWYDSPWCYHHGSTKVKCTLVYGVELLYHGTSWYNGLPCYKRTTPKTMLQFTMVLPPWYYHGETYFGFWGSTSLSSYVMVELNTMVQMYHLKNHDTLNHGSDTMVLPG
jgi:hypothetical protein